MDLIAKSDRGATNPETVWKISGGAPPIQWKIVFQSAHAAITVLDRWAAAPSAVREQYQIRRFHARVQAAASHQAHPVQVTNQDQLELQSETQGPPKRQRTEPRSAHSEQQPAVVHNAPQEPHLRRPVPIQAPQVAAASFLPPMAPLHAIPQYHAGPPVYMGQPSPFGPPTMAFAPYGPPPMAYVHHMQPPMTYAQPPALFGAPPPPFNPYGPAYPSGYPPHAFGRGL